jgi:outer membrane protein
MSKISIFSILLLTLFSQLMFGQSQVLEAYIQEGLKSNLQLKQEQLNYERSVENLDGSRALFMPQISAVANYTIAGGGRKISFPVGDLLNPVYSTLNQLTGSNSFPQIYQTPRYSEHFQP